ncbi:MFS transporter [Runella salmonicolor]|uniref:Multidrug efflux pump Tap n=1 Tax=Runella salmonicolor TaxID=2950278 RepID=A0ABT1FJ69_9BACT|nr:MFS transporter [Runella salmonicolor]MCP1381801.1 MFS transporter [Runella salmonicolor]
MKTSTNDPYAALRYPEFVRLISANSMITAAVMIQEVVIGYELYKLTHDPLSLGFIGLAEALPYISIALFGGHYADRKDKRTIMQISQSVILCCSLALIWVMYPAHRAEYSTTSLLLTVYGILAAIGFAKGFYSPASSSMKAFLTPREVYSNAATWSSTFWQTGAIAGPGIAGFLYAYIGLTNTLWVVVALFIVSQILLALIKKKPIPEVAGPEVNVWQSIKEGIKFVYEKKILFYATSLDLAAVLFGGVIAILPVFAEDILKVGAEGLGIMRAAPSVGAVLTIFATAYYTPTRNAWRNMLIAVAGFGVATLVFAISTNFWLSVFMLFLTGAFDAISVVIRQTILQVVPPDHMRGRVLSVNSVFISSSNEIGAFESGVAAKVFGTVPSVLIGGGLTMVIVTWVWLRSKELFGIKLT